jgi:hypothetical protein
VVGVTALEMETGDLHVLHAKTVLLATGGAHDDDVELAGRDVVACVCHLVQTLQSAWIAQPAQPTSHTMTRICSTRRMPTGLT